MDPQYVRDGVTKQCAVIAHRCNGLMCGCPCHDQDRARVRDRLAADAAPAPPESPTAPEPQPIRGMDVVRRLFGPTVLAGNLPAAAAAAEEVLAEHERQVREQIVREMSGASFAIAQGSYAEAIIGARVAKLVLERCAAIVRGEQTPLGQELAYIGPGVELTPMHLYALDCHRGALGMPLWSAVAVPGTLPDIAEINRAVAWWNSGGRGGH